MPSQQLKTLKILDMNRYAISIIVFLFSGLSSFAASTFEQGNAWYAKGRYVEAIKTYNEILHTGKESDALYFNLGNAYFKSDSLAKSIYCYEKALKLNPNDEDILRNLDFARGRITDKIEPLPQLIFSSLWIRYITSLEANTWALLCIFTCMLSALFFFLFLRAYQPVHRKWFFWSGTAFFGLGLWFIFTSAQSSDYFFGSQNAKAVVFESTVNVKSAPSEESLVLFVIHEGTTIKVQEEIEGWFRIRLDNGNSGWVKSGDIKVI
jgi:tetratricopeptide (TPR) repeat protein